MAMLVITRGYFNGEASAPGGVDQGQSNAEGQDVPTGTHRRGGADDFYITSPVMRKSGGQRPALDQ